ncbi:MAG: ABC transporter permease [Bdellovibrionales bacterium]|nr:ABC transporter permease [Bdellovibrionales bacterium]
MTKTFLAVYKREFLSYFRTPLAIVFLCVFLVLSGIFTFRLGGFYERGQADLQPFFLWHPWLYLFIAPAISMRLWAEERKSGTVELLCTLPISTFEATAGKFFAAWSFLALTLLLTFPIVITVLVLGSPDVGVILAGYLGSLLMAGAFLSLGLCVSAATDNQVISFVVSAAVGLVLVLLGFDPVLDTLRDIFPPVVVEELANFSFPYHFEAIQRGVVDLRDVIYFVLLIVFGLVGSTIVLDRAKAS